MSSAPGGVAGMVAYAAAVCGWAAWHLGWQAAFTAAAYRLWLAAHPDGSPSTRHRAALAGLVALPAVALGGIVAALAVLATDARVAAAGAAPPSTAAPAAAHTGAAVMQLAARLVAVDARGYDAAFDVAGPVAGVWVAGAAVAFGRLWAEWCCLGALGRTARPASRAVRRRVGALAQAIGLRRAPDVLVTATGAGPCVAGRARPVLILPDALASRTRTHTGGGALAPDEWDADEWDAVVLHELAHVRRGDYAVHWAVRLVEAACWWHPGVRRLGRAAADAREECCDAEAVRAAARVSSRSPASARAALARALVRLAEAQRPDRRGLVTVAAAGGSLTTRVRRLVGVDRAASARPSGVTRVRRGTAGLLAVAAAGAVPVGTLVAVAAAAAGQRLPLAAARSGTVPVRRIAIDAVDPGGRFSLRLLNGRVGEVTIGGRDVALTRVRVRGTRLVVRSATGAVALAADLDPRGVLRWTARGKLATPAR